MNNYEFVKATRDKLETVVKNLPDAKLLNVIASLRGSGVLGELYSAEFILNDLIDFISMEMRKRKLQLDPSESGPKLNSLKVENGFLFACICPDGANKVWCPLYRFDPETMMGGFVYNYFGDIIGNLGDFPVDALEFKPRANEDWDMPYRIFYKNVWCLRG